MTFANFVTIQYALLIGKLSLFNSIFPSFWIFATVFVAAYIPLATIIGYWHRKSQWKVEQEAAFNENVIGARMWLFVIELIEGNVTDEEKKQVREMLNQIIRREPIAKNRSSDTLKEFSNATQTQKEDG